MSGKWQRRDAKIQARRNRMPKHGRSLLTTIERVKEKKAHSAQLKCKTCEALISVKQARRNKGQCLNCSTGRD